MSHPLDVVLGDLAREYTRLIRHVHPQGFVPYEADLMAEAMERVGREYGHLSDQPLCDTAREIARGAGYDPARCIPLSIAGLSSMSELATQKIPNLLPDPRNLPDAQTD